MNDDVREWLESHGNELILGNLNLHAKEWSDGIDRRENGQAKDVEWWYGEHDYRILNNGMSTHVDRGRREESVPNVSLASECITGRCEWETWEELSSDHKPL